MPSSVGGACYISITGDTTSYSSCIVRNGNNISVVGCIPDIDSGTYNISIYDANDDCDVFSDIPAIVHEYVDISFSHAMTLIHSSTTTATKYSTTVSRPGTSYISVPITDSSIPAIMETDITISKWSMH